MNILHHVGLIVENIIFPLTAVIISGNMYHIGGLLIMLLGVLNIIAVIICEIMDTTVSTRRSTVHRLTKQWDYKYIYSIPACAYLHNAVIGIEERFYPAKLATSVLIIGFIVSIASKAVRLWALLENKFLYPSVSVHEGQYVCTTGPYAYVRHPFYFSCLLYYIGIALLFQSVSGSLYIVLLFCLYYNRIIEEEATLKTELKGYVEYTNHVSSKIIPMII